jgi:hypothetical protein
VPRHLTLEDYSSFDESTFHAGELVSFVLTDLRVVIPPESPPRSTSRDAHFPRILLTRAPPYSMMARVQRDLTVVVIAD